MPEIQASLQAIVPAAPAAVYSVIADYHVGHPAILPPEYLRNLKVEEGGVGAGTRISCELLAFGKVQRFQSRILEPEPGRTLVEADPDSDLTTTFTVDPGPGNQGALVTIATRYTRTGLAGWIERLAMPPLLRKVYAAELQLLQRRFE